MNSKFLDFLFGYEESEERFEESKLGSLGKHFSAKIIGGVGNAQAKSIFSHPFVKFISNINKALACLPIKSYGVLSLFFGITTMLMNFAEYYFEKLPSSPAFALIVGSVFTAIAIPLICIDSPLIEFLQKYRLTDALFFEILCLRRIRKNDVISIEFKWHFPIIIGIALAVLGFLLPLKAVLIALLALSLLSLTVSSPEFMFITTLFCLPLFPLMPYSTLILTLAVAATALSFALKVILSKRQFHFEQYDMALLCFSLFILISGIFNKDIASFEKAVSLIILVTAYFSASNIIVNRRIADNTVNIIIASSVPTAIYAIIDYFVSPEIHPEWLDPSFSGSITARATATFANPNIYAVFLIVTTVFSAIFALDKSLKEKRLLYAVPLILNLTALVLTWTRGAWIALIISVIAFAVIRSRACTKLLLIPILLIPVLLLFIPSSIKDRLLSAFNMSDSSVVSRLSVWRSSLRMFIENFFIGVGMGESAFSEEFLKYAEDSVTAPHSHNLLLEIGCEAGIFALLLFIYLLLIRVRHRASYARYVRNSSVDYLCTMSGTALFALLAFGMTDYIWYNSQMYVLFFTVFGIGSATLRISKSEYDDARLSHFGENSEASAQIDISISE